MSQGNVSTKPVRGKTWHFGKAQALDTTNAYGSTVVEEGQRMDFIDAAPASGGVASSRSGRRLTCLLVRNVSGITLEAKRVVTWQAGFRGRRVDGYCKANNENVAGVVDDLIGAQGVPNHDLFWLMVEGPALVKTSLAGNAENSFAADARVCALTAANSTGATTAGRITPLVATSNATDALTLALNYIGFAMSARTTGQTNTDTLVDLKLLK